MTNEQMIGRIDRAWADFGASHAGLSDRQLLMPGVTGAWSVRDLIAHVTWWEEEALTHLPVVGEGRKPPRYSVTYGGIDAFNALMTERSRGLSLEAVLERHHDVHERLRDFVRSVPAQLLTGETRFRRRLRLDTYGHYPLHAKGIRTWRERRGF